MDIEPTLSDVIEDYLRDCRRRGLRPATIRYYESALVRFARATEARCLADFDRARVRMFQDGSPTLSGVSMRGYLRALRTFSTWLASEGMTPTDRLKGLRLPRVDQRLRVVPSDAELRALIAVVSAHLRVQITLMIGTGLRISDVAALDVDDLRGGDLIVRTTKNRHGRLVPLDPTVASVLETYLVSSRREARDGFALFVNRLGYRMTANGMRQALDDARRRARIEIPVSPHVLRHWFARDVASHGTTDRLLAARMGWTTSTLQTRYAPVSEDELRADVARYAPVARLQAARLLDGLLPIGRSRRGAAPATARSNRVTGEIEAGRAGVARRS